MTLMAQHRRKCKLVNSEYSEVNLRQFEQLIINTVENTVPGKNPKVFASYFSTDPLTQGESVALGRELSKLPELSGYGKTITSFRLFDGRLYNSEEDSTPIASHQPKRSLKSKRIKGGHIQ